MERDHMAEGNQTPELQDLTPTAQQATERLEEVARANPPAQNPQEIPESGEIRDPRGIKVANELYSKPVSPQISEGIEAASERMQDVIEGKEPGDWTIQFGQLYERYIRLKATNPATLPPAEQAAYSTILEQFRNETKEIFKQAKEEGLLEDVDKALNEIYDVVRYRYKKEPGYVQQILTIARIGEKKTQISRYEEIETATSLEEGYWFTFGDEGGGWQPDQARFKGLRRTYFIEGIRRISQEFGRERGMEIPDEQLKLEEWEWDIKSRRDKEPKLWDRTEFNTIRFRSEILRDRADLERAFRQFIRDNLSTGNITVDFVLGEMQPLESQVRSEAHRLGLGGEVTNRLAAEAGGRLLLFAADWFARIGKRQEVQKIMTRFTDDSTEKVLGLALSYDGKPLEAGSLLSFTGDEGGIGLTSDMSLYKEFTDLGIKHPEDLRFIDYYRPDGPCGELYNDKVKGEKFQDLIKRALVNKLAKSSIVKPDEGVDVKEKRLKKASLGLEGENYKDISDSEFIELFNHSLENEEELNAIINDAMEAYYGISVIERGQRGGAVASDFIDKYKDKYPGIDLNTSEGREVLKTELEKITTRYRDKLEVDESKEAANIAIQLFTAFGFSSELLCPRIWKREFIKYEPDPDGKYVFDKEDGVYIPAMRRFKTDKNGQIQLDQSTGLPKAEFEYDPNLNRFRRVQGDYAMDANGDRILISIEEEIRERLGYDANNNNSFFPLDDRSRTVFLNPEYPKPGWMEEYRKHLDPKGFMRYVANLPEQRDLLIRKVGEDWKRYIRAHRQLMIDYAQDASENEKSDFSGLVPNDFFDRYREDHSGVVLSTPEVQESLKTEYLEFIKSGFAKERRAGVYEIPGMFAYQPDIIYGGGAPFAIKKDEYIGWWVIGDPIQNAQKTSDRSIAFISLLDTGVRSVARKYMGGPYFRRFVQGLALKAKGDPIVLDDYETQIWVGEFGGADDLRLSAVGRDIEGRGYQSGFLHSFLDKKEELKNSVVLNFYDAGIQNTPIDWKKFNKEQQYKLLDILVNVFNRQFTFAASYLVHNERSSVHEEGKWFGVRFMNGVFDLAGSEYGYHAYPDLAHTLEVILNKVKLSQFQNKTPREVLIDLYVKNYR